MSSKSRLVRIVAVAAGLPVAVVIGLAAIWGEQLVLLGHKSHRLVGRTAAFERYLASPEHAEAKRRPYTVCVFGDSSHFYTLPEDHSMLPVLRDALAARGADDIAVYGTSFTAFTAWDYYLLLNRVVSEQPDLLVLPVQLGSFSTAWLRNRAWHFPSLHRYLPVGEYARAFGVEIEGRHFEWEQLALQRIDDALFDGRATPFFGGIRYLWNLGLAGLDLWAAERGMGRWPPLADAVAVAPPWQRIDPNIATDHPLFRVFDLIDELARRHGIEVLYYTGQLNESAYRRRGTDLRLGENYALIAKRIGGEPGVFTLDVATDVPESHFSDDSWHYTELGIRALADRLAEAIVAIRRGDAP